MVDCVALVTGGRNRRNKQKLAPATKLFCEVSLQPQPQPQPHPFDFGDLLEPFFFLFGTIPSWWWFVAKIFFFVCLERLFQLVVCLWRSQESSLSPTHIYSHDIPSWILIEYFESRARGQKHGSQPRHKRCL
jgi:hypothetical protein